MGLRKPDPSKHDGNLTPDVVLKNYYGYSQGEKVEGGIIAPTSSTGMGTPFQSGDNIGLQSPAQENGFHIAKGGKYGLVANKSYFGDATAADVASGKTFTSSAGLKVEGTGAMKTEKVIDNLAFNTTDKWVGWVYDKSLNAHLKITHLDGYVIYLPCHLIWYGYTSEEKGLVMPALYNGQYDVTKDSFIVHSDDTKIWVGGSSALKYYFSKIEVVTL